MQVSAAIAAHGGAPPEHSSSRSSPPDCSPPSDLSSAALLSLPPPCGISQSSNLNPFQFPIINFQSSSKTRQKVNLSSTSQQFTSSHPANQAGQKEADDRTLYVAFNGIGHKVA
jgi:hypothetical protein